MTINVNRLKPFYVTTPQNRRESNIFVRGDEKTEISQGFATKTSKNTPYTTLLQRFNNRKTLSRNEVKKKVCPFEAHLT